MVDADVDEGSEVRDVAHDPRAGHPGLQVLELLHVLAEGERHERRPGIPPGTLELGDDVLPGEGTQLFLELHGLAHERRSGAEELRQALAEAGGQGHERRVALGVDRGVVEGVLPPAHAQEAGRLLEGLRPEARHLQELLPRAEEPLLLAVLDDRAGEAGPDPGHVAEEVPRGGVEVDAHPVHAVLDHRVERPLQGGVGDVVLVLPHPDAARLDLHELGERVLEPPRDRDGPAHGGVELRKLRAGRVARAVDARARLAHEDHRQVEAGLAQGRAREHLGLAPPRPVADRHRRRRVLAGEADDRLAGGGLLLVGLEVDDVGRHEPARRVHRGQLAPGADAGVDAEHRPGAERRLEQPPAHVLGEDLGGGGVRRLLQHAVHLVLDRGADVVLEGDPARVAQDLGPRRVGHRAGRGLERGHEPRLELRVVGRPADRDLELVLRLAAPDREVAVGARRLPQGRDLLLEREVRLELAVGLRLLRLRRAQEAVLEVRPAHERPQLRRPRQPLDQDVARALDRGLGVGDALLLVAEGERPEVERLALLRRLRAVATAPDPVRERLEPRLPRDQGAVLLLLAVGVIEVLEGVEVPGGEDPLPQLRGERRVALDRLHDDPLAREDLLEELLRLQRPADGDLVEVARALLAVARDEGHGRALGRELEGGARPGEADVRAAGREPGIEGGGEGFAHGSVARRAPMLPLFGVAGKSPLRGGRAGGRANVRA